MAAPALSDCPLLFGAVGRFAYENAAVESSAAVENALAAAGACVQMGDLFATLVQHMTLSFDSALRWALFLTLAPAQAVEDGDPPFSGDAPLDASAALALVGSVFDLATHDAVWQHFDDDDDESDESDEECSSN